LTLKETKDILRDECIHAIAELQDNLRSKESKLAGYWRKGIKTVRMLVQLLLWNQTTMLSNMAPLESIQT